MARMVLPKHHCLQRFRLDDGQWAELEKLVGRAIADDRRAGIEGAISTYRERIGAYGQAARTSITGQVLKELGDACTVFREALGDVLNLPTSDEAFLKWRENDLIGAGSEMERQIWFWASRHERKPKFCAKKINAAKSINKQKSVYERCIESVLASSVGEKDRNFIYGIYENVADLSIFISRARSRLEGGGGLERDPYIDDLLNALADHFYALGGGRSRATLLTFVRCVLTFLSERKGKTEEDSEERHKERFPLHYGFVDVMYRSHALLTYVDIGNEGALDKRLKAARKAARKARGPAARASAGGESAEEGAGGA